MKITYIDPPSGWRFGFPKIIPNDIKNKKEWIIENGYPKELVLEFGENFHYRMWEEEINENNKKDINPVISDDFQIGPNGAYESMSKDELFEHLISFQIYLNDRKLITNHDWDFEKEAKKYVKKFLK